MVITGRLSAAAFATVGLVAPTLASAAGSSGSPAPHVYAEAAINREEIVLAKSSLEGAVRLGAEPTEIPLGANPLGSILNGVRTAGDAARIFLVLEDVQAKAAPGVPFEVFLGVANGSDASAATAEKVGDIFLYDLKPTRRSFEATAAIKALLGRAPPDRLLAVTIRPIPSTSAQTEGALNLGRELEKADVTVKAAQLIAQ